MRRMLSPLFFALSLLLSHVMCAHVSYSYCELVWGGRYACYSAPPHVALFLAIPYLAGIALCLLLAYWTRKFRKE